MREVAEKEIAPSRIWIEKCPSQEENFGYAISVLPNMAYLELTPACNNRCPGCSNTSFIADFGTRALQADFHRRPLPAAEWDHILDRLGPFVRFLSLTGGEATLHPDLDAIVTSIDRRAIDFVIFTNARWRDPEGLIALLSQLPHFKGFLISLHGAAAETHETFSGVAGSFEETVANIALAVRAGFAVNTSTVITHQNVSELALIDALSRELGAQEAVFNRYLIPAIREAQPVDEGVLADMAPTRSELRAAVRMIEDLRKEADATHQIGYGPCIPQCFTPSGSQGCSAGESFLVVDPWGNVKPCTDTTLYCGNLLQQSLEEIWHGQAMQSWRDLIPSGCSGCAALAKCRTGCRAMALASGLGRDPLMTEPISAPNGTRAAHFIPLISLHT